MAWECTKCGACCKLAWLIEPTMADDSGKCMHLKDNICGIYDERPDICRVKDYSKEDALNRACEQIRRSSV